MLDWKAVEVLPGEDLSLPGGETDNHYYSARRTDAAPLRVGKEQEKLLFYRGVGDLNIPVRPRFVGNKIEIQPAGQSSVAGVVLFENRAGKVGYRVIGELKDSVQIDPPELTGNIAAMRHELADALVTAGLYPKEAQAMLDTWRDSWFEEGMRVMYIVPRAIVDAELPLTIAPQPAETARVFVGRIEMLSPSIEQEIANGARQYGRFLDAFLAMMRPHNPSVAAAFRGNLTVGAAPCTR
jgi:hypothetical protein